MKIDCLRREENSMRLLTFSMINLEREGIYSKGIFWNVLGTLKNFKNEKS
jgi:hypothetical protein